MLYWTLEYHLFVFKNINNPGQLLFDSLCIDKFTCLYFSPQIAKFWKQKINKELISFNKIYWKCLYQVRSYWLCWKRKNPLQWYSFMINNINVHRPRFDKMYIKLIFTTYVVSLRTHTERLVSNLNIF